MIGTNDEPTRYLERFSPVKDKSYIRKVVKWKRKEDWACSLCCEEIRQELRNTKKPWLKHHTKQCTILPGQWVVMIVNSKNKVCKVEHLFHHPLENLIVTQLYDHHKN